MYKKLLSLGVAVMALASCTCNKPYEMRPIQDEDKQLDCKHTVLSINEAEQYRKTAMETRGIASQPLLPLCWMPTYFAAQSAIKAADDRLEYLGNVYDVLGCGNKSSGQGRTLPPPPPYRPGSLPSTHRRPLPPPM